MHTGLCKYAYVSISTRKGKVQFFFTIPQSHVLLVMQCRLKWPAALHKQTERTEWSEWNYILLVGWMEMEPALYSIVLLSPSLTAAQYMLISRSRKASKVFRLTRQRASERGAEQKKLEKNWHDSKYGQCWWWWVMCSHWLAKAYMHAYTL